MTQEIEPRSDILSRYRIINNGQEGNLARYKVQRKGWLWWSDCPVAGRFRSIFYNSIGIYETEEDAQLALTDLARRATESELRKF